MNIKRIIAFAIAFTIVSMIVHTLGAFVEMPYYLDEAYFSVWSKVMMPGPGPPPAEFYYYSIISNLITGLLIGGVFSFLRNGIPAKRKGLCFGLIIFLVASIPSAFTMFLIINLPAMLILIWTIQALIIFLIVGWLAEKIIK